MIAAGEFKSFAGVACDGLAVKTGAAWSRLGAPLANLVSASKFVTYDNQLHVVAQASNGNVGVLRYASGAWAQTGRLQWTFRGPGGGDINDILTADLGDGPKLYAFGKFSSVEGVAVRKAAVWDGVNWTQLGTGVSNLTPASLYPGAALFSAQVYNDGSGPAIFVTGVRTMLIQPGADVQHRVFKWNGSAWSAADAGLPPEPDVIEVDFPAIPKLFVFQSQLWGWIDNGLYVWNGTTWTPSAATPPASTKIEYVGLANLGAGIRAYFSTANDLVSIAGWDLQEFDGTSFTPVAAAGRFIANHPQVLYTPAAGANPDVWFGGNFVGAGGPSVPASPYTISGVSSASIARWHCPTPPCPADFNGVGGVTVQDIFDFLSAWFAGNASADFNHAGGVTVQDIFDFLAAWFAGC